MTTGILYTDSALVKIFPSREVPLANALKLPVKFKGMVHECYFLDRSRCTSDQLFDMAQHVAQCGLATCSEALAMVTGGNPFPLRVTNFVGVQLSLRLAQKRKDGSGWNPGKADPSKCPPQESNAGC